MKIVLASNNQKKKKELYTLLSQYIDNIEILSLSDVGIFGDIVEDGETFAENALIKARCAAESGYIGIGDDSGLAVDALGGAPGIYSARYAGEHGNDKRNNQKLLSDMKGIEERGGAFVCAIACAFPQNMQIDDFCVRGECRGSVLCEEKGEGGFGYDPLFFVEKYGRTYAELSSNEKNEISHRAVATKCFAEQFSKVFENKE